MNERARSTRPRAWMPADRRSLCLFSFSSFPPTAIDKLSVAAAGRAWTLFGSRKNPKPEKRLKMATNPTCPVHALLAADELEDSLADKRHLLPTCRHAAGGLLVNSISETGQASVLTPSLPGFIFIRLLLSLIHISEPT